MTKLTKRNDFDPKGFNDLFLKENIKNKKKSLKLEKNYLDKLNKNINNRKKKKIDLHFYYYKISKILIDIINNISNIKKIPNNYNKDNYIKSNNIFHYSIIIIFIVFFCILLD